MSSLAELSQRPNFRLLIPRAVAWNSLAIPGEGVNIAARLEALCDPGGLLVSGKVHDEVDGKVTVSFENRGEQKVNREAREGVCSLQRSRHPSAKLASCPADAG